MKSRQYCNSSLLESQISIFHRSEVSILRLPTHTTTSTGARWNEEFSSGHKCHKSTKIDISHRTSRRSPKFSALKTNPYYPDPKIRCQEDSILNENLKCKIEY